MLPGSSTVLWGLLASLVTRATCASGSPPVVDLGYQLHQGNLDETGAFYNFSNIRYSRPPTGQNRFRAPQSPHINRSAVHDGKLGRVCPQAYPGWFSLLPWLETWQPGQIPNVTKEQVAELAGFPTSLLPELDRPDPRITEDCLFLDVIVPKAVVDATNSKRSIGRRFGPPSGAPVLVWIHGGGYSSGDKSDFSAASSPDHLLTASTSYGNENAIFVSINYRLGAFGFIAGPTIEADGVANAGLLDQRFALEWVQRNIAHFGGNPNRVTVIGESAGAASLIHHITSYGGSGGPLPFQQVIIQSPDFRPSTSPAIEETVFGTFLNYSGVTDLASARSAPTSQLQLANALQIARSEYGGFTYGPVVDGTYVPATPGILLAEGKFAHDVNIIVAQNQNEGLVFTNPTVQTEQDFLALIHTVLPTANSTLIQEIAETVYPAQFDGTYGYTDEIERQEVMIGDVFIKCNNVYVSNAFNNATHGYIFDVPPALHAQDVAYTFYNGVNVVPSSVGLGNETIYPPAAADLQAIIKSFTMLGCPRYANGQELPVWGPSAQVLNLTGSPTPEIIVDPSAGARCLFWQAHLAELSS